MKSSSRFVLIFLLLLGLVACGGRSRGSAFPSDTTPPTAPYGLVATPVSSTRIDLSWSPATDDVGVQGYKVFRDGRLLGTANVMIYSDTGLTPSTSHDYRVSAYDAAGNTGPLSQNASAATPASSGGSTYFVDFVSGTDVKSGTSPDAPWKHAPGDANASGNAKRTLKPGDWVLFKGGVVYNGHITVGQSGSEVDGPVVYATAPGWGSGRAILDGTGVASGLDKSLANGILIDHQSYVAIRDLEFRNFGVDHSLPGLWWGAEGITVQDSEQIEITDTFIHDMDDWSTNMTGPNGSGLSVSGSSNVIIRGNEITRTGHTGILIGGGSRIDVHDNDIHDYVVWGMDIVSYPSALSAIQVHDNRFHDLTQYDNLGPHSDYIIV
jgi:parallel beta-helix repeat protein